MIAAGYQPGPMFKAMLNAAEDAQLEGKVASQAAALQLVQGIFPLLLHE